MLRHSVHSYGMLRHATALSLLLLLAGGAMLATVHATALSLLLLVLHIITKSTTINKTPRKQLITIQEHRN